MKPLFWIRNLISSGRHARLIGHVEILQQQLAEAQQQAETAQHDYEVENAASERLHNQLANANQRLNILEHAFEKIQGECCSVGIALEFTKFPAHWNSKKPQHTETPEEES